MTAQNHTLTLTASYALPHDLNKSTFGFIHREVVAKHPASYYEKRGRVVVDGRRSYCPDIETACAFLDQNERAIRFMDLTGRKPDWERIAKEGRHG